jgi:hypothetical protein
MHERCDTCSAEQIIVRALPTTVSEAGDTQPAAALREA